MPNGIKGLRIGCKRSAPNEKPASRETDWSDLAPQRRLVNPEKIDARYIFPLAKCNAMRYILSMQTGRRPQAGETEMIAYKFGTYTETADGNAFRLIASGKYDSDAQAELEASRILDCPEEYNLADMDGNQIKRITIRRDGAEWVA